MKSKKKEKILTSKQLINRIAKRLKPISKLNFLESYAMFMGKAQLVELGIKGLLITKYKMNEEDISKWTLGKSIYYLEKKGLRSDFVLLLKELLDYRNELAHDYLAITASGTSVAGKAFMKLQQKQLRHALYKVEEVIQVHDFLLDNNYL